MKPFWIWRVMKGAKRPIDFFALWIVTSVFPGLIGAAVFEEVFRRFPWFGVFVALGIGLGVAIWTWTYTDGLDDRHDR